MIDQPFAAHVIDEGILYLFTFYALYVENNGIQCVGSEDELKLEKAVLNAWNY